MLSSSVGLCSILKHPRIEKWVDFSPRRKLLAFWYGFIYFSLDFCLWLKGNFSSSFTGSYLQLSVLHNTCAYTCIILVHGIKICIWWLGWYKPCDLCQIWVANLYGAAGVLSFVKDQFLTFFLLYTMSEF